MKSALLPLALLLLAPASYAVPTIRFFTEQTTLTPGRDVMVYLENTSNETAHDLVVTLELPPTLRDAQPTATTIHWACSRLPTGAVCRTSEFQPGSFDLISFSLAPAVSTGGHHFATVTFQMRELETPQTITFDVITSHVRVVSTTDDFGPRSLRAAIEEVNDNPLCGTEVPCLIFFSLAPPATIAPATPLPPIRKCNLFIAGADGWEIPAPVKPVAISGENATVGNGLEIRAACAPDVPGVGIHGMAIHSWPENGILFDTPSPQPPRTAHIVTRTYIGTDVTGTIARPNGYRGIATVSPYDVVSVSNGVISGNRHSGVALWNGHHVRLTDLKIGVDRDGKPLGNGSSGVFSNGVPVVVASNTIAHNGHFGIAVTEGTREASLTSNTIRDNLGLPIDWGLDGRTLPEDETDGVLNPPQIVEAFYDAGSNATVVRGFVRLRAGVFGTLFSLEPYLAVTERGDVSTRLPAPDILLYAPASGEAGDVPFEVRIYGNYRGRLVALQTHSGEVRGWMTISSEISEAATVR